jgi:hypothetical protein
VKRLLLAAALFALGACSGRHIRNVGTEPTPFVIQNGTSSSGPAVAAPGSDSRSESELAGATAAERNREHRGCEIDADCEGRLRCVSYHGVSGRELRQCLFSCLDGCPDGYSCQMQVADGPSNVCQRAR